MYNIGAVLMVHGQFVHGQVAQQQRKIMQLTEGKTRGNIKQYTTDQRPNCPPPSPKVDRLKSSDINLINELQDVLNKHRGNRR